MRQYGGEDSRRCHCQTARPGGTGRGAGAAEGNPGSQRGSSDQQAFIYDERDTGSGRSVVRIASVAALGGRFLLGYDSALINGAVAAVGDRFNAALSTGLRCGLGPARRRGRCSDHREDRRLLRLAVRRVGGRGAVLLSALVTGFAPDQVGKGSPCGSLPLRQDDGGPRRWVPTVDLLPSIGTRRPIHLAYDDIFTSDTVRRPHMRNPQPPCTARPGSGPGVHVLVRVAVGVLGRGAHSRVVVPWQWRGQDSGESLGLPLGDEGQDSSPSTWVRCVPEENEPTLTDRPRVLVSWTTGPRSSGNGRRCPSANVPKLR